IRDPFREEPLAAERSLRSAASARGRLRLVRCRLAVTEDSPSETLLGTSRAPPRAGVQHGNRRSHYRQRATGQNCGASFQLAREPGKLETCPTVLAGSP